MTAHRFSRSTAISVAALALAALAISGCGTNVVSAPTGTTTSSVIQGSVFGGSSPIVGANVVLWQTYTTPAGTYPSASNKPTTSNILAGSLSGAVTTSTSGGFSFNSDSYTCTPGSYVYITATGGSTNGVAGGQVNNNSVQAAALGPCSNFGTTAGSNSNIRLTINEATTVAVAYTLGSFTYVDNTTPGFQGVYIGAPAENSVATGSCTGAGSTMTCTAAGLGHAFQNAYNIVDAYHTDGSVPSGYGRVTVPGNAQSSVPQAQINMLANMLQYCTNSTGGAASAAGGTSDGTTCGNLFAHAKPVSCTASSCAPVDELTAAIDISKNPENNISTLFAYVGGTATAFQPTLTAAPQNLAIAITYSGDGTTAFGSPQYLALDANDNVYVLNADASTPTEAGVAALQSNGTKIWNNGLSTSLTVPKFVVTDTVGNVWISNDATAANGASINAYAQATGSATHVLTTTSTPAIQSQPVGLAIDQNNNLWYDQSSSSSAALYEIPYSSGGSTGGTYSSPSVVATGLGMLNEIVFDESQNVWFSTYGNSSSATPANLYVVPNNNAATPSTAPAYTATTSPFVYSAASPFYTWGLSVDGSGNVWAEQNKAFEELTETKTAGVISANPTASLTTGSTENKPYETQFDGAGQIWFPYFSTTGEIYFIYNPSAGGSTSLKGIVPCYIPAPATPTCSSALVIDNPTSLQIDSAGSIWVSGEGSVATGAGNGNVVQIIGPAYPVWPQLSYAHYGVMP